MVKAYMSELVNEVMYDSVQLHGGTGFMRESGSNSITTTALILKLSCEDARLVLCMPSEWSTSFDVSQRQ